MPPSLLPLLLLLVLLVCRVQATHFYGTLMTYDPKHTNVDGSMEVAFRYKLNFHSCSSSDSWDCLSGNCGVGNPVLHKVDEESGGDWCQREGIMTRLVPTNAPFQMRLNGGNWINGIRNGIVSWRALTLVELRNRSDTDRANRSPQTTILPSVRVPSNCQRDFNLLMFDPDGDEVKCRYGDAALSECNPCTPASVLSLSPSCSLSFSPTNSSNEGPYAVQLVMEDFPRQNITLTQTDGSQVVKTPNDAISKLPVQFAVRVDPAVPSCTEGLYLPKFLPPTPANGARLFIFGNQTLEINISAVASNSTLPGTRSYVLYNSNTDAQVCQECIKGKRANHTGLSANRISELLFSGPFSTTETASGAGQFTLRWTPSEDEKGQSHPFCFVVQAVSNSSVKYHSELRCVIVSYGNETIIPTTTPPTTTPLTTTPSIITPITAVINQIVLGLKMRLSSSSPLSEEQLRSTVIQQLKGELVRFGLPPDISLRLVSSMQLGPTTTASPVPNV